MIFLTEMDWNTTILKVILGVSDGMAFNPIQKPNGNVSGTILYGFEFKWKPQITAIVFGEYLVIFDTVIK